MTNTLIHRVFTQLIKGGEHAFITPHLFCRFYLPARIQHHWQVLGYVAETWGQSGLPDTMHKKWVDLTYSEAKSAETLGFDGKVWDGCAGAGLDTGK